MKKIKYIVDAIMLVIMICLMELDITGMLWHEILGLTVIGIFAVHKFLNFNWIKSISKNIFKGKVNGKNKFMYILDWTLFILTIITGITGVCISKEIFTSIAFSNIKLLTLVHNISAYVLIAGISIHIGLHLKNILISIKRLVGIKDIEGRNKIGKLMAIILTIVGLLVYMSDEKIKNIFKTLVNSNESSKVSVNENDESIFKSENKKYKLVSFAAAVSEVTLEQKLSTTICTGCHRMCPLSNPQCQIGEAKAAELKAEYINNATQSTSQTQTEVIIDPPTQDVSVEDTSENTSENSNSIVEDTSSNTTNKNISNTLFEMGFWIGGTYYIMEKIEEKKRKDKNK